MTTGITQAIPSFTRQTGMACSTCHTQSFGPNLNTYGRQFKLNGYTWGSNESYLSRFGGMAIGSFTNTKKNNPDLASPLVNADPTDPAALAQAKALDNRNYNSNNNLAFDQASLFYGGKVFGQMGAFVQFTYDGVASRFALDNTDIRIADEQDWLGQNFVYGLSFNNGPTVQDLWNTTPAWGFPYASSPLANTPGGGFMYQGAPAISNVGGQVGGATLYTMINDMVFLEAGAYGSFAKYAQKGMGQWNYGAVKLDGGAPYWRVALQKDWKGHYVSLGHFGFRANVQPDVTLPAADRYTDLGMDFNYQYLANPAHIYEFKASYIREQQELLATYNQGAGADHANQQLGFLGLNGTYTYDQTYGVSLGFNHIYGSRDTVLYSASPTNKPNSEFFTAEFDYVPFGKTASAGASSYLNLRFAAQYVAYTRFDGAAKFYNAGADRNVNASDNNTLYFNTWLSF